MRAPNSVTALAVSNGGKAPVGFAKRSQIHCLWELVVCAHSKGRKFVGGGIAKDRESIRMKRIRKIIATIGTIGTIGSVILTIGLHEESKTFCRWPPSPVSVTEEE